LCATTGMIGMIAPSPMANTRVGKKAANATERRLKGRSGVLVTRQLYGRAGVPRFKENLSPVALLVDGGGRRRQKALEMGQGTGG
jgi:hypothetical protein